MGILEAISRARDQLYERVGYSPTLIRMHPRLISDLYRSVRETDSAVNLHGIYGGTCSVMGMEIREDRSLSERGMSVGIVAPWSFGPAEGMECFDPAIEIPLESAEESARRLGYEIADDATQQLRQDQNIDDLKP